MLYCIWGVVSERRGSRRRVGGNYHEETVGWVCRDRGDRAGTRPDTVPPILTVVGPEEPPQPDNNMRDSMEMEGMLSRAPLQAVFIL